MEIHHLKQLFSTFLNDKVTLIGGEKVTGKEFIEERKRIYDLYRQKFSPAQIKYLTENEFHHFLTPSGNKSWSNLQRKCKQVTLEMERLKEALLHLQREEIPVEERLNNVLKGGKFYIWGFGKNLATGLLHVFDWEKYGVWNNRSQKVLAYLKRLPYISSHLGESYIRFNSELRKLAKELETDLAHLDGFLWWFDENEIK